MIADLPSLLGQHAGLLLGASCCLVFVYAVLLPLVTSSRSVPRDLPWVGLPTSKYQSQGAAEKANGDANGSLHGDMKGQDGHVQAQARNPSVFARARARVATLVSLRDMLREGYENVSAYFFYTFLLLRRHLHLCLWCIWSARLMR